MFGGDGDDRLESEDGHDRLEGGQRTDRLDGGSGDDVLVSGHSADQFVFKGAFGRDAIVDFRHDDVTILDCGRFADFKDLMSKTLV